MLIYINQFVLCILGVCYVKYILNVFEMDKLFYSQIQRLFCLGKSYFVFLKLVSFDFLNLYHLTVLLMNNFSLLN